MWERGWYEFIPFNITTWYQPLMPLTEFSNLSNTLDNLIKEFEGLQGLDLKDIFSNLGEAMSKGGFIRTGSTL